MVEVTEVIAVAGYGALPDVYEWLIPDDIQALHVSWDELPDHLDAATFDLVFCVGSLGHAEGASGRLAALAAMSRLLKRGGRLVLTSRNWELVRAGGSRMDIRERLEELVGQLQSAGLTVESTTFDPDAEGYLVVASSGQA